MAGNHKEFLYLKCKILGEDYTLIQSIEQFENIIQNSAWSGALFILKFDINLIKNKRQISFNNPKRMVKNLHYDFNENILYRMYIYSIESNMSIFYHKGEWKAYIISNSKEKQKAIEIYDDNKGINYRDLKNYKTNLFKFYLKANVMINFETWFYEKDEKYIEKYIGELPTAMEDYDLFTTLKISATEFGTGKYSHKSTISEYSKRAIENQGAYCYFNTTLQCLYNILTVDSEEFKGRSFELWTYFNEKIYQPAFTVGKYELMNFRHFIKSTDSTIKYDKSLSMGLEKIHYGLDGNDINITNQYTSYYFTHNILYYLVIPFQEIDGISFFKDIIGEKPLNCISYKKNSNFDNYLEIENLFKNTKYLLVKYVATFNKYINDYNTYTERYNSRETSDDKSFIELYYSQRPTIKEYMDFKVKNIAKKIKIIDENKSEKIFNFIGCDLYSNKTNGTFGHYRWYQYAKPDAGFVFDDTNKYNFIEPNADFTYALYKLV